MVKTFTLLVLGSLITALSGCAAASSPSASPGPADFSGTWIGGNATGTKDVRMQLQQSGTNVTGTLAGAGAALDGPIQGTVEGNALRLVQRSGGALPRTLSIRGDLMDGMLDGIPLKLVRFGGPPSPSNPSR